MSLKTSLDVSAEDRKIILKVINPTGAEKHRRGSNTRCDENFLEVRAVTALAEQASLIQSARRGASSKPQGRSQGSGSRFLRKRGGGCGYNRRAGQQLVLRAPGLADPAPPNTIRLRAQAIASHWFTGESKRRMKCGLGSLSRGQCLHIWPYPHGCAIASQLQAPVLGQVHSRKEREESPSDHPCPL